jgi:methyl-accepting chemotaxis protein
MSIHTKILMGFALILLLGAVLAMAGMDSTRTLLVLSNTAHDMQNRVTGISNVLNAHYIWRQGLTETVLTGSEFKGSLDPNACALGKWLQSPEAKKISDPEVITLLQQVRTPHAYIHGEAGIILQDVTTGNRDEAKKLLTEAVLPKTQEVISLLTKIQERAALVTNNKTQEIVDTGTYFNHRIMLLAAVTLGISLILALVITQWITHRVYWLESILDVMPYPISVTDMHRRWTFINKPVEGLLGKKRAALLGQPCSNWGAGICNTENCGLNCLERGQEETAFAQGGMNFKVVSEFLTNKNGKQVGHIEVVEDVSKFFARQKADIALAKNINQSIVELSGAISEIASKTKENAALSVRAADLANTIKQNAEKSSTQMGEMTSAVSDINQSSQKINNVIQVINDITFQTNLLALNASVEAARVGEQGKGFAVVADEVRNLAIRSRDAASNTDSLIQESLTKAALGVRIADDTASSLSNIVSDINNSNQIASEIAKSSEEQSAAILQINQSIEQVSQLIKQSLDMSESDDKTLLLA